MIMSGGERTQVEELTMGGVQDMISSSTGPAANFENIYTFTMLRRRSKWV